MIVINLGPIPFSEPEAEAMKDFIVDSYSKGVNFQSYISVHSYGQVTNLI
jgi:hypothetical protein